MGIARIFQRGGHTESSIGYSLDCHLNIVGCLLTKRLRKGGSRGTPGPPWLHPWAARACKVHLNLNSFVLRIFLSGFPVSTNFSKMLFINRQSAHVKFWQRSWRDYQDLPEISPHVRGLAEMAEILPGSPRSRQDGRDLAEMVEILPKLLRSRQYLAKCKIFVRSRQDLTKHEIFAEISPRSLPRFGTWQDLAKISLSGKSWARSLPRSQP